MPTSLCSGNRMSKCELIELKDLSLNDRIELAAPSTRPPAAPLTPRQVRAPERPRPSQAVRLVGDSVRVEGATWSIGESGKGHDFQPCSHTQLTWCDLCGDFIWGLYKQSLRCDSKLYSSDVAFQDFQLIVCVCVELFQMKCPLRVFCVKQTCVQYSYDREAKYVCCQPIRMNLSQIMTLSAGSFMFLKHPTRSWEHISGEFPWKTCF